MKNYLPVIGLEIHVELKTKSKMFCQCQGNYFGKKPNSNTCPVCLGLPGALPVPNRQAIEWTALIGKSLGCRINRVSKFDRKHYFYPDLPKGYQISQYDEPIAVNGKVTISSPLNQNKTFQITRVHLEEDTGKLQHSGSDTLVDFNRSGVPLVEIVTEPCFTGSDDVKAFLEELRVIIRYLGVSEADMEKGSMRLEPNISLKKPGEEGMPKYKVEVKNINSFRYVKQAIEYELVRQAEILDKGELPLQETRGFDENKVITFSQRSKEESHDYRYFPEPDIPPLVLDQKFLRKVESELPELPHQKQERFITQYHIKPQDAFLLTRDRDLANYFDVCVGYAKLQQFAAMEQKIANSIINKKISTGLSPDKYVEAVREQSAPKQTDESALQDAVNKVVGEQAKVVADYKAGKTNAIMFLVGQVMKELKGRADAQQVKKQIEDQIITNG